MILIDDQPLTLEELELVKVALEDLVVYVNERPDRDPSVCWWLEERLSYKMPRRLWIMTHYWNYLRELMWSWEGFSGVKDYPVPSPIGDHHHYAFMMLDKWTGEYGASRRAMVDYMLKCISADIEKVCHHDASRP